MLILSSLKEILRPNAQISTGQTMSNRLTQQLDIDYPIIQAPMAGVSTPELAAAVSNAGALGSLGLGLNR
jgi:NAD(P)H-dependent flavin oxidoreductase YrpB (nitropropane dioxygenase family)